MHNISKQQLSRLDILIYQAVALYKTKYESSLNSKGLKQLTLLELGILNLLEWHEDLSTRDILKMLKIPNSTLTSAINRMEQKGILSRQIHPTDKRTFQLRLRAKGKKLMAHRITQKQLLFQDILAAFPTTAERDTFLTLAEQVLVQLAEKTEGV